MSAITPTAYTVKDPGNGKQRRYEGDHWILTISRAEQTWGVLVEAYPSLTKAIVPDHFVQEYCRCCDAASWSGSYGPGDGAPAEIMLKLLDVATGRGDLNFIDGKV
jgi:hypothetical protein